MDKASLLKRGLRLEYVTLVWNVFECAITLYAGILASSIALIGFGIDSLIEIFASAVVIWQLRSGNSEKEKFAEKLIGISFILVSLYIFVQAASSLLGHQYPGASILGIVSLLIASGEMTFLGVAKAKVGKKLNNAVLMREANVTKIDGMLAASVLVGLLLNMIFGWWWADPVAGLIIVFYGLKEGYEALKA